MVEGEKHYNYEQTLERTYDAKLINLRVVSSEEMINTGLGGSSIF